MPGKFLTEAVTKTAKQVKIDPILGFKHYLVDPHRWRVYVKNLAEGITDPQVRRDFYQLAENERVELLKENSMYQNNPYETLTVPVLRKFYPRLIAKELVTTGSIDKPEVIKAFIKPRIGVFETLSTENPYPYAFPYIREYGPSGETTRDITRGPKVSIGIDSTNCAPGVVNLIQLSGLTGLTNRDVHVEKDITISGATLELTTDGTTYTGRVQVNAGIDVDSNFSVDVSARLVNEDNTNDTTTVTDKIVGHVDLVNGILSWRSVNNLVKYISVKYVLSLEENTINPKVLFAIEKIRIVAKLRQISSSWTIPFEQDIKALYQLDVQDELTNIMAEQIAIDIDREIIDDLIAYNTMNNGNNHTATFYAVPPSNYQLGPKEWLSNILVYLTKLSARVYNDTLIGPANTIACNPEDAAIFENLNTFRMDGSSDEGGNVGYEKYTIQGGKWKILVSNVVPRRTMILVLKSPEEAKSIYFYCPYVPVTITPYPLANIPTMTIMTRYGTQIVRPEGIAVIKIDPNAPAGTGYGTEWWQ